MPTHDRGHTIDLSLSTVAASAEISKDCGSDHRTILTRIRPREKPPRRQYGISLPPEETERFVDRVKYFANLLPRPPPSPLETDGEIDEAAERIQNLITSAIRSLGRKKRSAGKKLA